MGKCAQLMDNWQIKGVLDNKDGADHDIKYSLDVLKG
jgi:hypothetical protein